MRAKRPKSHFKARMNGEGVGAWVEVEGWNDPGSVAEEYAAKLRMDGAELVEFEIDVLSPDGEVTSWDVGVEFTPIFHATRREESGKIQPDLDDE